jgi:hypothetical protein
MATAAAPFAFDLERNNRRDGSGHVVLTNV